MNRQTNCIMKSEYEISQRTSLSSFSSERGAPITIFRGLAMQRTPGLGSLLAEERAQFRLDRARRIARLQPDDALHDHLPVQHFVAVLPVKLLRDRDEYRVAGEDAVERRQQRDAHLGD